jgi:hypothetical protein
MRGEKLGYCERWVLAYLRANDGEDNTAPEIAAALEDLGVMTNGTQRVGYALRQLERGRSSRCASRSGARCVLWSPACGDGGHVDRN